MSADFNEYRKNLSRLKDHPNSADHFGFTDNRDSFVVVYSSVIPFVIAEYFAEASYEFVPAGLVFPMGFLLFWAYYYTYYKPDLLEERLSNPTQWNLSQWPALFLGLGIWFVKVSVMSVVRILAAKFVAFLFVEGEKAAPPPPRSKARAYDKTERKASAPSKETPQRSAPPKLPSDIYQALAVLGFEKESGVPEDWRKIHRRYRELAKRYHPDLNPEATGLGRKFIQIDLAYRKLHSVKEKYFRAAS